MTFTVTYRDTDGARREEVFEAASRAACVSECKARGILPMQIEAARPGRRRVMPGVWKGIAGAAVVLLLAGGAWRIARTRSARPAGGEKKTLAPAHGRDVQPPRKTARAGADAPRTAQETKEVARADAQGRVPSAGGATDTAAKLSPEDAAAFERVKRETSLRTQVENRMALLATIKPGMPVPPMPPIANLEQDFAHAEANVIEATEGDTEQDLMRKQFVIALKERISAAKKEGKTAAEALNDYVETMRQVADFRQKSLLAARQMERDGDAEGAKRLVESVNADLAEVGAELIDLHPAPKGKKKLANRKENGK